MSVFIRLTEIEHIKAEIRYISLMKDILILRDGKDKVDTLISELKQQLLDKESI